MKGQAHPHSTGVVVRLFAHGEQRLEPVPAGHVLIEVVQLGVHRPRACRRVLHVLQRRRVVVIHLAGDLEYGRSAPCGGRAQVRCGWRLC